MTEVPSAACVPSPAGRSPAGRLRAKSYMAVVLAPEGPVDAWLAGLDAMAEKAAGFFLGRPVVLDVGGLAGDGEAMTSLLEGLARRDVRIIAVENWRARSTNLGQTSTPPPADPLVGDVAPASTGSPPASAAGSVVRQTRFVDSVRSGCCVVHMAGDLVVLGNVASGAEVVAGGSLHVYGALRGRALAGARGDPQARIFCRLFDPELVALDGLYKTADDLAEDRRGGAAQIRLSGEYLSVEPIA